MKQLWPKKRLEELALLELLLDEIICLNRSNNFIQRVQRCEKLAEELKDSNIEAGHLSFYQFLIDQAWEKDK